MEEIIVSPSDERLQSEYDSTFSGDEKATNTLKLSRGDFTIERGVIDLDSLLIPDPIKKSRDKTYLGLTTSIAEMGIINPINVMISEGYEDWLEENTAEREDTEYEGFKYILIDGFRRVYAGYKNGITKCDAIIWNFEDKDKGVDLAVTLSLLLNKFQDRSWSEKWYLYQILETESAMTPGTLEYLLQLKPGDAMKLKDIMQSGYQEVIEGLLSDKKDITQSYNALQKLRKEEDILQREDNQGISNMEQADGVIEKAKDAVLSNEQVKDLLEMGTSFEGDLSDEEFDALMGNDVEDYRQTVGERHPLDPALRAAVLQRDGYCCQISGVGKGLPVSIALSILNVHHKVPVHCGGTDTEDNLITVSLDAHTLIHVIERNMGKLNMSKEDFNNLSEKDQKFIQGVMSIARIAVEANRALGKTRDTVKKEAEVPKFKMPGVVQKENMSAVTGTSV